MKSLAQTEASPESICPLGAEPSCDIRCWARGPRQVGSLPFMGIWNRSRSRCSVGMPPPYGDLEATYGGLMVGLRLKSSECSASIVGGWVWAKRPFKAGPSGRNQGRTHPPTHDPQRAGGQPRATLWA